MTEVHSAASDLSDLIEGAPASLWVFDRDQIQYRLADGRLRLGPDGLAGPVTELVAPTGCRDRMVAGPADTIALFCGGQFVAKTELHHRLSETRTDSVHLGPVEAA
jgi:hypothetical protein